MTELRQAREVDMVPEELRYVPQVKSDIIIQRRNVSLAPIEAAETYTRTGTNTITFNVQGHRELSQLLDTKSLYFTMWNKFEHGYPVEDVAMLFEEIIISSNGRVIERIRHAQYIQHFIRGYGMSRKSKARLGKRSGFQRFEDRTVQYKRNLAGDIIGFRKSDSTELAPDTIPGGGGFAAANALLQKGRGGYCDTIDDEECPLWTCPGNGAAAGPVIAPAAAAYGAGGWGQATDAEGMFTRMSENLGYHHDQVQRVTEGTARTGTAYGGGSMLMTAVAAGGIDVAKYKLMKFRLHCSGLLSSDKMLPIGFMPLTIQLRLSDPKRATDSGIGGDFNYEIKRPRLHMNVCSVGQAYASAMQQRLRGPGITLNCKMFDTYFQIIKNDKQIVIPSNKQRLSKVWVFFHKNKDDTNQGLNAFRSSVTGDHCYQGVNANNGSLALRSYQFQVGTEVSEAVTLEDSTKDLDGTSVNTGLAYLESYLRAIGAVNGHEQDTEFWGRDLDPLKCNDWEGGDLLQTFLSKYFCCVYDGEKLLGSQVETGVDTESGKDIVVDLRWASSLNRDTRVMVLIQYHAQVIMKENDVQLSY